MMSKEFVSENKSTPTVPTISRRTFLKAAAASALALGLGDQVGTLYEKHIIESQLHSGRLFFLTEEKLGALFGEQILSDTRFKRHTTTQGKQLRCDMMHFARTDQANQLYKKLLGLVHNKHEISIETGDQVQLLGKPTEHIPVSLHMKKIGPVSEETIVQIYDDIVMYIRDTIESKQYTWRPQRYFATAGVSSDINANLISMYLGKQQTLIDCIIEDFGILDPQSCEIRTNFRGSQELESIFGDIIYQKNTPASEALMNYLRIPSKINATPIKSSYPGVEIIRSTSV